MTLATGWPNNNHNDAALLGLLSEFFVSGAEATCCWAVDFRCFVRAD